jgi:hypothetical protein
MTLTSNNADIIFLDFVAVVNIVLPWIDFKAAMISSWWSIIVCSAFEVVNSYTTDLSGINNLITVDDKSTWVNDYNKEVIRQINIDNDNITKFYI